MKQNGAPLTRDALCPDAPAVGVDDSLGDGEPQSGTAVVGSALLPEAIESAHSRISSGEICSVSAVVSAAAEIQAAASGLRRS